MIQFYQYIQSDPRLRSFLITILIQKIVKRQSNVAKIYSGQFYKLSFTSFSYLTVVKHSNLVYNFYKSVNGIKMVFIIKHLLYGYIYAYQVLILANGIA